MGSPRNIASPVNPQLAIQPVPKLVFPSKLLLAFPDLKQVQDDWNRQMSEWRAKTNVAVFGINPP